MSESSVHILYTDSLRRTLTNSEDPEEMLQSAAFHQVKIAELSRL